jgi:CMP-N,N'-diacetyllegionaminic acid synthase
LTSDLDYIAVIPARGGSKGIPKKNICECAGKPLIAWTLDAAVQATRIDRILLSTDDPEIMEIGRDYGVEVIERPPELASDTAHTEPVMLHALDQLVDKDNHIKGVVLLQPTSPLRTGEHIDDAIHHFAQTGADSLLSVCSTHHFFWKNRLTPTPFYDVNNRPRRQDITPEGVWYRENGAIYISRLKGFMGHKNRLFGRVEMYVMEEQDSIEVDVDIELLIADLLLGQRMKK